MVITRKQAEAAKAEKASSAPDPDASSPNPVNLSEEEPKTKETPVKENTPPKKRVRKPKAAEAEDASSASDTRAPPTSSAGPSEEGSARKKTSAKKETPSPKTSATKPNVGADSNKGKKERAKSSNQKKGKGKAIVTRSASSHDKTPKDANKDDSAVDTAHNADPKPGKPRTQNALGDLPDVKKGRKAPSKQPVAKYSNQKPCATGGNPYLYYRTQRPRKKKISREQIARNSAKARKGFGRNKATEKGPEGATNKEISDDMNRILGGRHLEEDPGMSSSGKTTQVKGAIKKDRPAKGKAKAVQSDQTPSSGIVGAEYGSESGPFKSTRSRKRNADIPDNAAQPGPSNKSKGKQKEAEVVPRVEEADEEYADGLGEDRRENPKRRKKG